MQVAFLLQLVGYWSDDLGHPRYDVFVLALDLEKFKQVRHHIFLDHLNFDNFKDELNALDGFYLDEQVAVVYHFEDLRDVCLKQPFVLYQAIMVLAQILFEKCSAVKTNFVIRVLTHLLKQLQNCSISVDCRLSAPQDQTRQKSIAHLAPWKLIFSIGQFSDGFNCS